MVGRKEAETRRSLTRSSSPPFPGREATLLRDHAALPFEPAGAAACSGRAGPAFPHGGGGRCGVGGSSPEDASRASYVERRRRDNFCSAPIASSNCSTSDVSRMPSALQMSASSMRSSRRSPASYFDTKLCGRSSRLANSRCVRPASSRAWRKSVVRATCCGVWMLLPTIEVGSSRRNIPIWDQLWPSGVHPGPLSADGEGVNRAERPKNCQEPK